MGHLSSGECNRDQDRNGLCFCGASVLVGDVLMESYTGSRDGDGENQEDVSCLT